MPAMKPMAGGGIPRVANPTTGGQRKSFRRSFLAPSKLATPSAPKPPTAPKQPGFAAKPSKPQAVIKMDEIEKYSQNRDVRERQQAAERGALLGGAIGAFGGYKAAKGAKRIQSGVESSKRSYKLSRDVDRLSNWGPSTNGQKLKNIGTAASTGVNTTLRAPKGKMTMPALAVGYLGGLGGVITGSVQGEKAIKARQAERKKLAAEATKKITKASTISAFGIDHG